MGAVCREGGKAGAGSGGVGDAVFGGVGDDFVEEETPVGVGDADVGMFGSLFCGDAGEFGIELGAGGGEGGDSGGKQRDHEAAGAERVEGVDFVFEVGAGVAGGSAAVVESSGEEEHGLRRIEFEVRRS